MYNAQSTNLIEGTTVDYLMNQKITYVRKSFSSQIWLLLVQENYFLTQVFVEMQNNTIYNLYK